jgi:hypothetical protein
MHITTWCYLWDLVDEGIDDTLLAMKDDLGLTALSVATHYHSVEHYRPHAPADKPFIYRDDSALNFIPDLSRFGSTRIRHRVSEVAKRGNPLRQVADKARALGLELVSWTIACHSSHLGRAYPECAMRNALGDRYPEALCPANPEVRGFVTGLVDDLSHNYGIAVAELESANYAPGRHYHHHEKIAIEPGPADNLRLMLCFCEHCAARGRAAGVDVEKLRDQVGAEIRDAFARGEPSGETVETLIERTAGLAAFLDARVEGVTSLVREIKAAAAPGCVVSPIVWPAREAAGLDVRALADLTGCVTIAAYTDDPEVARRQIRDSARLAGGVEKLRVGYHTYPPIVPSREALLEVIRASLDEGVRAFTFYNYGIAPRRSLEWMGEAARLIRARLK